MKNKLAIISIAFSTLLFSLIFAFNFSQSGAIAEEIEISTVSYTHFSAQNHLDALTLMATYCYACHTHEGVGGRDNRLAPPMFRVREHYVSKTNSREDFIDDMVNYVQKPDSEMSKMPGAIRNFGLMPALPLSDEMLFLIAGYIYDNDLASDEWKLKWLEFKHSRGE